jgi:hypothetical protein
MGEKQSFDARYGHEDRGTLTDVLGSFNLFVWKALASTWPAEKPPSIIKSKGAHLVGA